MSGVDRSFEYDAFISHHRRDQLVASHLDELFKHCGLHVFLAHENLLLQGSDDYYSGIVHAIKSSRTFIPILTPQSATSTWVAMETGIARGDAAPAIHPAYVAGVNPQDTGVRPLVNNENCYALADEEELLLLICQVMFHAMGGSGAKVWLPEVVRFIGEPGGRDKLENVRSAAQRRSIFIAGSYHNEQAGAQVDELQVNGEPQAGRAAAPIIATDIARELLSKGFVVASCPEVALVGEEVMFAAEDFCAGSDATLSEVYEIGGLQNMALGGARHRHYADAEWRKVHQRFRKSYLKHYQLLIVIGGGPGTREEVDAATELMIPTVPVPMLGGEGQRLFRSRTVPDSCRLFADERTWPEGAAKEMVDLLNERWSRFRAIEEEAASGPEP